jgi:hypothetical protein
MEAVNASPIYTKPQAEEFRPVGEKEFSLGNYRLSQLTSDSLRLPEFEGYSDAFDLERFAGTQNPLQVNDLREQGAAIAEMLRDVLPQNPTPAEFQQYMKEIYEKLLATGIERSIADMVETENKLRRGTEPIERLDDGAKYPLYIWALVMNPPATPVPPRVALAPTPTSEAPAAPEAPAT